jgi:hypothetical protein
MVVKYARQQSMWWPYWRWAASDPDKVTTIARSMKRMGQDEVVLMGMEWGSQYALPSDEALVRSLDIFWENRIRPRLALWVGQLDQAELDMAIRAWKAGQGRWANVILDAEHQWKRFHSEQPARSTANLKHFFSEMRDVRGMRRIGYAPYGVPTFHKSYDYNLWNNHADFVMPQIYFTGDDDAVKILNRAERSWDAVSESFDRPLVPMIPIGNCYSENADAAQRKAYGELAIQRYGRVSWWRYPIENPLVRDVLRGL